MSDSGAANEAATDPAAAETEVEETPAFDATAVQQRRKDRNQLQFRGTAKSESHADAVLRYLQSFPEIANDASRNVATSKLLQMLDPAQNAENRYRLVKNQSNITNQDIEMTEQEEPTTPNRDQSQQIQELEIQLRSATATTNHLARKLSLNIDVDTPPTNINRELKDNLKIVER